MLERQEERLVELQSKGRLLQYGGERILCEEATEVGGRVDVNEAFALPGERGGEGGVAPKREEHYSTGDTDDRYAVPGIEDHHCARKSSLFFGEVKIATVHCVEPKAERRKSVTAIIDVYVRAKITASDVSGGECNGCDEQLGNEKPHWRHLQTRPTCRKVFRVRAGTRAGTRAQRPGNRYR